jgi:hypothetical protein
VEEIELCFGVCREEFRINFSQDKGSPGQHFNAQLSEYEEVITPSTGKFGPNLIKT